MSDGCGLVDTALGMARARLERLKEYEGCRVMVCVGEDRECYSGVLVEVDITAATVTLRDPIDDGLVITTIDPHNWELQVYKCPGGKGE